MSESFRASRYNSSTPFVSRPDDFRREQRLSSSRTELQSPSSSTSTSDASVGFHVGEASDGRYRKLAPKPQSRRGRPKQTSTVEVDPALEQQRALDLRSQFIVWDTTKRDASLSHCAPGPQEEVPRPFLWLNPQTGQNSTHALQTPQPSSSVHISHSGIPRAPNPASETEDMPQTLPPLQEHFAHTLDAWNPGDAGNKTKKIVPRYSPYDMPRSTYGR
ncbi:hypothetical protein SISSUDRAFT_1036725 [Sistotremastrum suecicum HHB10207 ss-3]|uniref:Uncharacterized protein n=1 Tax=Sistotremastrum suecicum HHB10207 ss-3 TaxID=1314776 RepID=A0A165Z2T2_9AGAM|nr:hypothetical protein SISSUDRAFT_1036725 [Sistotremastrum suecicum HHB10207 ss-3]